MERTPRRLRGEALAVRCRMALRLRRAGYTFYAIAARYQVTYETARYWCRKGEAAEFLQAQQKVLNR